MRIAFCSSETVPFAKTGGLADVSGALPPAIEALGCEVKLFMPLYDSIQVEDHGFVFAGDLEGLSIPVPGGVRSVNVFHGHLPGSTVDVYLIDCPHYYHRGAVYTNDRDEDERFITLQHAAFQIMQRYAWAPDLLHCNDWQAALMPAMLRRSYSWDGLFKDTASLLSIHNIAYQGRFADTAIDHAGLPRDEFFPGGPFELDGAFSFLKAGIVYADTIATVSPTYAKEIQTAAYGAGLEGVLNARSADLSGILNGIDSTVWNPSLDPHIPVNYGVDSLNKKAENTRLLLEEFGMPYDPSVPVFGIVSRFAAQKGLELLRPILAELLAEEAMQLVVLGSGDPDLEDFFSWAATNYPNRVGAYIGYSDPLAHRIEAGADCFLMPSHYEPCGLNQMYSLAYGTLPVVRKTGGLADTVSDWHESQGLGNGFSFYEASEHALMSTIKRTIATFRDKKAWQTMQKRGMKTDLSWSASAQRYLSLYEHTVQKRRG